MKKLILMALFVLGAGIVWASMGNPTVTDLPQKSRNSDSHMVLGNAVGPTPSMTPSTDTSSAMNAVGYGTKQFRFAMTTYWGALSLQGSMDGTTYTTIWKTTTSAATTQTVYWETSEPWNYFKVVTLPSINNTGTVATQTNFLVQNNGHTGYYGPHRVTQNLLADASRSAATINALEPYFQTDGKGVKVLLKQVSDSSGSLAWTLYSVGQNGEMTAQGDGFSGVTTAGTYSITVSPYATNASLPSAVTTPTAADINNHVCVGSGNSWYLDLTESGTSTEFSVDVIPIP